MNLKYEETVIDGVTFGCTEFPAMRAFTLFGRLMKTIGPVMIALSRADGEADVMSILPAALRDVEPEELTKLALETLSNTTANTGSALIPLNSADAMNAVFSGRLIAMVKAVAFAVGVNYKDFFAGAAESGQSAAKPATSA